MIGEGLFIDPSINAPNDYFEVVARYPNVDLALAAKDRPKARIAVLEWPSLFEQSVLRFNQILRSEGMKAALAWREARLDKDA